MRFLHQLALRSKAAGEWKPDTARIAWRTVLASEQANSRPEAIAWVRGLLDEADASLHEVKVLFLPDAANYATWGQIASACDEASAKYQLVSDRQRAIREARTALSRALAALVSLIPYLEASPTAELQSDWLEAATQSGELARMLEPPTAQKPGALEAVAVMVNAAGRLNGLSRRLLAPFQPAAVRAIVERCRTEVPLDPELATRIDATLMTPFLAAADRQALYDAERLLDARLEKTWNPDSPEGSSGAARAGQPGARARRRFERMAAFLKLAGDANTSRLLDDFRRTVEQAGGSKSPIGSDLPWDMTDPATVWAAMARCARAGLRRSSILSSNPKRVEMSSTGPAGWRRPMPPGSATCPPTRPGAAGSGPLGTPGTGWPATTGTRAATWAVCWIPTVCSGGQPANARPTIRAPRKSRCSSTGRPRRFRSRHCDRPLRPTSSSS